MASKDKTPDNRINIYFFIGRTNPPHQAHIDVLIETIRLSRQGQHNKYPALFLLGDGPGGIRTRDNPVEHELKKQFIVEKLRLNEFNENVDFVIEKMKQPPNLQVAEFIKKYISEDVTHVTIYQVAGGKDNDGAKHSRIRDDICKKLRELYKNITFDCGVFISDVSTSGQDNSAAMSATIVRKKAVEFFNEHHKGKNLEHWIDTSTEEDEAFQEWIKTFEFYKSPIQLSFELFKQIILYKDTPLYKPMKSVRAHPYQRSNVNSRSKRVLTAVGGKRYSRRGYYRNRKKYITRKRR